jgi:tetratricopeptide (TPR) repeat protein
LSEHREEIRRLYTPAMLSQLLNVTVHVIRGWERAGLIRPLKKVFRLPYFDFQDVTSARRLSQLLAAGVPRKEIEEGLRKLPSVARGDQRPLEQLEILARNAHVVVRDAHGLKVPASGQRVFDFEPAGEPARESSADDAITEPPSISIESARPQELWTSGDWFGQGCRLYDEGRLSDAAEAFRLSLMTDPQDPEKHFHLADCLYRMDNAPGALERYYVSVELDRNYLEAWTQIGCLHRELGELDSALTAFEIAIDVHPDYPDAHFHKAETLSDLGRLEEALPHWRRYLAFDSRGPWAEMARQRLHDAEPALAE